MAYADVPAVVARLGRDLTADETSRSVALLDDASDLVTGYTGQEFTEPYPGAVVGVTAKIVARAFARAASTGGEFVSQQSAGPFSTSYSPASSVGDLWLTAADKLALRPYRRGGGLTSVKFVGERYNIEAD